MSVNGNPQTLKLTRTIEVARAELGVREAAGDADNPRIAEYFGAAGFPAVEHDSTAWCAAFACFVLREAGFEPPRTLRARDFLAWGTAVSYPAVGAVVVLSRGSNPALGHVGFVTEAEQTRIRIIAGNTGDEVREYWIPRDEKILGFRLPGPVSVSISKQSFQALADEYARLWDNKTFNEDLHLHNSASVSVDRILNNKDVYKRIENATNVPWWFVGCVHALEGAGDLNKSLADGSDTEDFERDAVAALRQHGLHRVFEWTLERALYEAERWNGFGYRLYHDDVKTPYLWSGTEYYGRGKYIADGKFDPAAVSRQAGFALILHNLCKEDPSFALRREMERDPPHVVISRSKSLKTLINTGILWVLVQFGNLGEYATWVIQNLPQLWNQNRPAVQTVQEAARELNLPWGTAATGVLIIALVVVGLREYRRKEHR